MLMQHIRICVYMPNLDIKECNGPGYLVKAHLCYYRRSVSSDCHLLLHRLV